MKKSFKKSLMILLSIIMVMTMAMPVAFAEGEPANVAITFENQSLENASASGGLRVRNIANTASGREGVEGHNIGNRITFDFGTEMDPETLNPQNIKIYLETSVGVDTSRVNSETKEWTYTNYDATATSYTIYLSDMCQGAMKHTVTFTDGVKTADGNSISEVSKNFVTGRISTISPSSGKVLSDVAYGKKFVGDNNTERTDWTTYSSLYSSATKTFASTGVAYRVDLGNYYDIADVVLYNDVSYWTSANYCTVQVAYSNDPNATYAEATVWGTLTKGKYYSGTPSGITGALWQTALDSGRCGFRHLNPSANVRARYVFIKVTNDGGNTYGERTIKVNVLANVDTDFGAITATKDGEAVTEFEGAGEYTVSVPVTEYVSGTSAGYMIVAGYDANGVVTKINCKPVTEIVDGKLSLATTFTDSTKSLKAVLIKDFTQPQMLTDALHIQAPTVAQE